MKWLSSTKSPNIYSLFESKLPYFLTIFLDNGKHLIPSRKITKHVGIRHVYSQIPLNNYKCISKSQERDWEFEQLDRYQITHSPRASCIIFFENASFVIYMYIKG